MFLLMIIDLLFYTQMLEPVFRGLSRDRGQEEALWFGEIWSAAYIANTAHSALPSDPATLLSERMC